MNCLSRKLIGLNAKRHGSLKHVDPTSADLITPTKNEWIQVLYKSQIIVSYENNASATKLSKLLFNFGNTSTAPSN